jgi:hypothetical protein
LQHHAVIEVIDRVTWIGGAGLSQPPDGLFRVASPIGQETQTMKGIRVRRCAVQHQAIRSFRIIEPARLMMHLRLAKERRGGGRAIHAPGFARMDLFIAPALFTIHNSSSSNGVTSRLAE